MKHTASETNHWMNAEICHQTDSSDPFIAMNFNWKYTNPANPVTNLTQKASAKSLNGWNRNYSNDSAILVYATNDCVILSHMLLISVKVCLIEPSMLGNRFGIMKFIRKWSVFMNFFFVHLTWIKLVISVFYIIQVGARKNPHVKNTIFSMIFIIPNHFLNLSNPEW